jgi:glycosyltransferase involved in cell wall biosynthesis
MSDLELLPPVERILYVSSRYHALLADGAWKPGGPNIGAAGANLTISFLSRNCVMHSERLVRSIAAHIPAFAGELLIIDHGSPRAELAQLRSLCAEQRYRWRIIELGRNIGVAAARNEAVAQAEADWIMSLDNDVHLISNPLPIIQTDLARLGCHFINIPVQSPHSGTLVAQHGHLCVKSENGDVCIVYRRACKRPTEESIRKAHLCTFLFGGASVFKRASVQQVGGYDEALCGGVQDIDFSLRVFQLGYKVGSAGTVALSHDPAPGPGAEDADRCSTSDAVIASFNRFQDKHGISVAGDILRSLATEGTSGIVRRRPARQDQTLHIQPADSKPKIALVIDTDGWAFSNIACQLQRYLSDRFHFTIIPMGVVGNLIRVIVMCRDCQLIHFFWREDVRLISTPYYTMHIERLGLTYNEFEERFMRSRKVTTSIYDHLFLNPEELSARLPTYRNVVAGYSVASNKLRDIYSAVPGYPPPTAILEDGVDLRLFRPIDLNRFEAPTTRELVVGWAGNSKWLSETEDFKGVHTILKPALEELRAEGLSVRALLADRHDNWLPHDQMPSYYSQIDVYVCTSKIEGTPNPVLEAMACGVPVISTDVGVVRQAFGPLQQEFILAERSIEAVKAALRRLYCDPALFRELSEENLHSIQAWDWSIKAAKFGLFFDAVLSG